MKKRHTLGAQTPGRPRRAVARARRVDRLPQLFGLTRDAAEYLDRLRVLIIGVGSIGATVALSLARLQIGYLGLVDRSKFKVTSLLTQPVGPECIGKQKASYIAKLCRAISSRTRVEAWDAPLRELPLAAMADVDVVVLAGDNLTLERDTGQRCLNLGLPLIHAAVHGDSLTAQCRFFAGSEAAGPCPVCLFGADEFRMLDEERVWSCEGAQPHEQAESGRSLQPTMSVRALCGLAGDMAALLVIRWALGLGAPVLDRMTEISAYTWRTFVTPLRRNPSCPAHHERWQIARARRSLPDLSLAELLRVAGLNGAQHGQATICVRQHRWVERGLCGCAEAKPVHRFVRHGEMAQARCLRCGRPVFPQPFFSHEFIPVPWLKSWKKRSLRQLGAGRSREVLLNVAQRNVLVVQPARERSNPHPRVRSEVANNLAGGSARAASTPSRPRAGRKESVRRPVGSAALRGATARSASRSTSLTATFNHPPPEQ